jgi:hypothetical protein
MKSFLRSFIFCCLLSCSIPLFSQSVIDQLIGVYSKSFLIKQIVFAESKNEVYFIEKSLIDNQIIYIKKVEDIIYRNGILFSTKQYYKQVEIDKPYFFSGFDYLQPIPLNEFDHDKEILNIWVSEEEYSPVNIRDYLPSQLNNSNIIDVLSVYYHNEYYIFLVRLYNGDIYDKLISFPERSLKRD